MIGLERVRRAGAGLRAFAERPAGRPAVVVMWGVILVLPAWFMADHLRYAALFGDDFAYIAESKDAPTFVANLFVPHNTHIVPLFRLWTFALVAASPEPAAMPGVFRAASYVGLVAAMLATGLLVRRETGRTTPAALAMAVLGGSSALNPTIRWFSAGQALWSGTAVVATLWLARGWEEKGGRARFFAVLVAALAAPLIWTGGHVAGAAAACWLWTARRRADSLKAGAALAAASFLNVLLEVFLVRRELRGTPIVWERHAELWPRPIQSVFHSFQAVVEELMLGNLGLESATTPFQAVVLTIGLLALWTATRGGRRPSPSETAGLAIVGLSYLMVYTFRGNLPFDSLRPVRWYHAVPQVGAVLFAAGWWAEATSPRGEAKNAGGRFTRGACLGILAFLVAQYGAQAPRSERLLLADAPAMVESETMRFPTVELKRLRALYFLEVRLDRQVRHLKRLATAEALCARLGIGPATLRRAFGRIIMPGIPEKQTGTDVVDVMRLPPDQPGRPLPSPDVLATLRTLLSPEPETLAPWLAPPPPGSFRLH